MIRGRTPVAERAVVLRYVDLVARGAGHPVPGQHRHTGLIAGSAQIGVGPRVSEVVAQVEVLDRRR